MRTPLQKGEDILLVTHHTWLKLVVPFLIAIIGIVASIFIGFLEWGWIAALVGLLYCFIAWLAWKCNTWVVTNYRVIDETGLINHYAKESPLDKINNVSYDQSLWGRIFNYGHVTIQTAAEIGETDYQDVHGPKKLKDTITLAQSEFKNLQLSNQAKQMAAAMNLNTSTSPGSGGHGSHSMASELEKLFQLKQQGILSEEEYLKAKNRLLNG
jgi:uncharacterized membrane protein YdbT with pleckstrin-like domain